MKSQTGIISEVRYTKIGRGMMCEVRVKVDGRDTNWLPKRTTVGSAWKVHIPPRVGDQVIVHNENGKNEDGYVSDNIAFVDHPLPKGIGKDKAIMYMKDGTHITFDLKNKKIEVKTPSNIKVSSPNVEVKADKVKVIASEVTIDADTIKLDGEVTITEDCKIEGDLTVEGDTELEGDLSITGSSVEHNGTNIGDSHTHGYDGEPS